MVDGYRELNEVRSKITELKARKDSLAHQKLTAGIEIGEARGRIRGGGRMPDQEYRALNAKMLFHQRRLSETEREIMRVNASLRSLYDKESEIRDSLGINSRHGSSDDGGLRKRVVAMRNKYLLFAEDQTRVNSMRVLAAQVASDITSALQEG